MKGFLILLAFVFWSIVGQAAPEGDCAFEKTVETGSIQVLQLRVCKTPPDYDSLFFQVRWQSAKSSSFKKSQMVFAPDRELPTELKYITVQNDKDELVPLNSSDQRWLAEAQKHFRAPSRYSVFIQDWLNLLITSTTVSESYFELSDEMNVYVDDGHIWAAGWYTADDVLSYVMAPVADPETQCYGRKGSQCGAPNFSRESLNHDLCHRITGDNLTGECAGEFLEAAFSSTDEDPLKALF